MNLSPLNLEEKSDKNGEYLPFGKMSLSGITHFADRIDLSKYSFFDSLPESSLDILKSVTNVRGTADMETCFFGGPSFFTMSDLCHPILDIYSSCKKDNLVFLNAERVERRLLGELRSPEYIVTDSYSGTESSAVHPRPSPAIQYEVHFPKALGNVLFEEAPVVNTKEPRNRHERRARNKNSRIKR